MGELQTLLNKLPRKKPAPGVEFVPFEDMIKTFDADGNGTIELDEWLNNLQKLPGIRMAIESVMDFDTGMLTVDLQQAEEQLRALSHQKLRTFVRCSEFRTQNPFPVRWGDLFFISAHQSVPTNMFGLHQSEQIFMFGLFRPLMKKAALFLFGLFRLLIERLRLL